MRPITCLFVLTLLALNGVQAKAAYQVHPYNSDQDPLLWLLKFENVLPDTAKPEIIPHIFEDSLPYFMLPFSFRVLSVQTLGSGDQLITLRFQSIGVNEEVIYSGRGRLKVDPDDVLINAFQEVGDTGVFFLAIPVDIVEQAESSTQPLGWELNYPITVNGFWGSELFPYSDFVMQVTELTIQFAGD